MITASVMKELYHATLVVDIIRAYNTTLLSTIFEKLKIATEELKRACSKWE